jgi:hypothetical protein
MQSSTRRLQVLAVGIARSRWRIKPGSVRGHGWTPEGAAERGKGQTETAHRRKRECGSARVNLTEEVPFWNSTEFESWHTTIVTPNNCRFYLLAIPNHAPLSGDRRVIGAHMQRHV